MFFGRNVTDKVSNQNMLYMPPQITGAFAMVKWANTNIAFLTHAW